MIATTVFRLGLAACLAGLPALAMAQDAAKPDAPASVTAEAAQPEVKTHAPDEIKPDQPARASAPKPGAPAAMALDATPGAATPDPLTPPEPVGPPPKAPGAPEKPAQPAAAPLPEPDPVATQILASLTKSGGKSDTREDVAGLTAFYTETKGQPIWTSASGFTPKALKAVHEIRNAGEWGLDASAFQLPANPGDKAKPETLAEAEIKLSLAVLKYARHARGGRLDPTSLSPIIDRHPHIYDPKSVLEAISVADSADAYLRGLHPKHEAFKRLRQALLALSKTGGGGPAQIPAGPDFRPGDDNSQIALVRKRLGAGADGIRETSYDTALLEAVNRYQREHGLPVTGIIDRKLRASLNETGGGSADDKKLRLIVNMERWRWMPDNLGEFYVWDSITEQYTRVFDHGKMTLMEKIVVGKPTTPTPTFSASMQFIVFNPEWGVPDGIKVNEIAPRLRSAGGGGGGFFFFGGGGSSEILQRLGGLRVSMNGHPVDPDSVDWSSVDIRRYQFIQGAGGKNVLGVVKFRFPNKHDVYMHDTPDRHLFGGAPRAFSHGCMRTQNPVHLAEVLLAHDKGYSPAQVREMVATGQTNEIKLTTQIPVHVAYFTAEADDQGHVHYYPDLYGLDGRVAAALRGEPVHFAHEPAISAEEDGGYPAEPSARQRGRPRHPAAERRPWNPFEDWN